MGESDVRANGDTWMTNSRQGSADVLGKYTMSVCLSLTKNMSATEHVNVKLPFVRFQIVCCFDETQEFSGISRM